MIRPTITVPDLGPVFDGAESQVAEFTTAAMRGATKFLNQVMRDQVRSAGHGSRLANTWRWAVYPDSRNALNPAGWVWSNAPEIINSFATGATIVPIGEKNFLWIPTKNVPNQGGRGATKPMTPFEVEVAFDQDLIIRRGRNGHFLAFVSAIRARNKRGGLRRITRGRLAQGRDAELVLMFTLLPSAQMPHDLDLEGPADRAGDDFVNRLNDAG